MHTRCRLRTHSRADVHVKGRAILCTQVSTGVAGATLVAAAWQGATLGLPTAVYNSGWALWTVPLGVPSGQYLMRITSNATPANNATVVAPFSLRTLVLYEALLLPQGTGLGTATSLQVKICRRWAHAYM